MAGGAATTSATCTGTNRHVGGSCAEVSLDSEDLVVECTQFQPNCSPGVEVVTSGDGSAGAVGLADGPVLGKVSSADDRWLIHAFSLINVV